MSDTVVEIEGCNGEWFTIAGPRAGDRGVTLGEKGIKGSFLDQKVKVTYETPGNWPGARFVNARPERRDFQIAVEVFNDPGSSSTGIIFRESEWRKAWSFRKVTKIHVTTKESGHRVMYVRLNEMPEINLERDPKTRTSTRVVLSVTAGDPFWFGDEAVYSAETKTSTMFNPSLFTPPWPWEELPGEELEFFCSPADGRGGANPTDTPVAPTWILPASTKDHGIEILPGIEIDLGKAPATVFLVPDYSFEDDEYADRRIKTPGLVYGENAVVNTDRRREQISAENGAPLWARMNAVRFLHMIPEWTPTAHFKVRASGCEPGQRVELRIPRPWTRPWGME